MSVAAFALGFFQIFFVVNLFASLKHGRVAGTNPWDATTLEWSATATPPRVYRDPYDYSLPGADRDFVPQNAYIGRVPRSGPAEG
jgi:cytochrome c oxidase subunit 1